MTTSSRRARRLSAALVAAAVLGAPLAAAPAQAATKGPDLVVTAVGWTTTPTIGAPVVFTATVKNVGDRATPGKVKHGVGFAVDGKLVTWSDTSTSALTAGASRTLTANSGPTGSAAWVARTGAHTVSAYVDDAGRIAERNEGNNIRRRSFTSADGGVDTTAAVVRVDGRDRLQVTHRTGVYPSASFVMSRAEGIATGACFRDADGSLVTGTVTSLGRLGAGELGAEPGGSGIYANRVDVAANSTGPARGIVQEGALLRDNYGLPISSTTCTAGTHGEFYQWKVDTIRSQRYDATTKAPLGADTTSTSLTFRF